IDGIGSVPEQVFVELLVSAPCVCVPERSSGKVAVLFRDLVDGIDVHPALEEKFEDLKTRLGLFSVARSKSAQIMKRILPGGLGPCSPLNFFHEFSYCQRIERLYRSYKSVIGSHKKSARYLITRGLATWSSLGK